MNPEILFSVVVVAALVATHFAVVATQQSRDRRWHAQLEAQEKRHKEILASTIAQCLAKSQQEGARAVATMTRAQGGVATPPVDEGPTLVRGQMTAATAGRFVGRDAPDEIIKAIDEAEAAAVKPRTPRFVVGSKP
jgi:hypothetical protein